ncbi:MAG: hypothetical protein EOO89_26520 [Pedobacter sp.]|nr:MAG: hypothetical protein EOO89_26520 [Pedobacter sp.]
MTTLKFPSYYSPFFRDDLEWSEKGELMASFSSGQLEEIDQYLKSIHWYYDSEEALIKLLDEIKTQLIVVGLPTIKFVKENAAKELDYYTLRLEMRTKSSQLYLMQLDPKSRFPVD